uniref:Glycosyl transferase family 25 domain-containing protein n=1 Tax=viral metagenome TaxID=1070528 RepID=A0A6C0AZ59_9ZZZZ
MKKKTIIAILVMVIIILLVIRFRPSSFGGTCNRINIDKVFILTLGTDTERYLNFKKSYTCDIPLEVILGVNTKIPENSEKYKELVEPEKFNKMYLYDKKIEKRPNQTYFNSGALGCYLGHLEFYKRCFSQNLKYALILEDNITLTSAFNDELKNLNLPSNFDVCFLHAFRYVGKETDQCGDNLIDMKWVNGTKAYLINVENMKKYYPLFYPINNHVDRVYEKLVSHGCNMYYKQFKSIKISTSVSTINHTDMIDEATQFFYLKEFSNNDIRVVEDYIY